MVVEFSQKDIENNEFGAEGRASSDQSLELALQGKEQYMASLEDRRTSKGRVHFPGGSQPSLDAWTLSIQGHVAARAPSMERLGPKRASAESIGACSLDAEASESSAPEARRMAKEASEVTLRSMVMSTRESLFVARGSVDSGRPPDGFVGTGFLYITPEGTAVQLSNGCWNVGGNTVEEWSSKVVEHRPSYLGISCAINGYTSYSQFCRSRDSSPARPNHKGVAIGQSPRAEPIVELAPPCEQTAFLNGCGKTSAPAPTAADDMEPGWSLVQQRIATLYGSEAADRVARSRTRTAKSPVKLVGPKRSPSCPAQAVRGRSKSPPVFRHLTKNFREHLRLSEVSASPAENLPGYIASPAKAASGRGAAVSPEKKRVVPIVRTCEVDGGDGAGLEGFAGRFASFQPQVLNGGVSKINGNHKVASSGEPEKGTTTEPEVQVARPAQVCPRALSSSDLPQREGHTFLATMASTQEALETRIRWTQEYLDQEGLSEDVKGRIRSAVGKANLLIAQKFQQFRELCLKNIEPKPDDPFPTTGSDLAGFWDMVMLQVENVHSVFDDLHSLKANNWQEPAKIESAKSSIPKPTTARKSASRSMPASPRRSAKGEEAARSREEARKRLMEAKRQARQANQASQDSGVAIFMPGEKHN
ncbi:disks large-associated protein, putative [Ixodes scapularis]|uniref:Disks large-associated protein, putative n=1 Tax=Ixodes scapularis TaxID=6945 RepID=B7P378_IXOSC|nr:disks large-associated protein, putative [Ixodes scapularis]|eukprot:XP_002403637.1 disks large-associated protein, putative [Ixodes scapularis]